MTGETWGRGNNEKGTAVTQASIEFISSYLVRTMLYLVSSFSFCWLITIYRFLPCVPVFTTLLVIFLYPKVISKLMFFSDSCQTK